jgi:hypothetical protein|uniref:Uncharacterized protein n=1 Tax=Siphoviridae sp. ctsoB6 TaxID=2826487 RepID=A0A8S5QPM2_9CAUD|nr:MAG TPA: hypothetical protein [Siphoviridae sp. ctsoB6]
MKKKEKYAKEIVELACNGKNIAVDKKTERPVVCSDFDCDKCMFRAENNCRRRYLLKEWAESEYIEKPVISKKDKDFLEYLKEEFKYIVRDRDGALFAYKNQLTTWFRLDCRFDVCFPMIKWEGNEEIWSIKDLKKLEVVEEYEENSR